MVNRQIWPDEVQPVEKLVFEHVEPKYVKVVIARITLVYLLLMGCATLILTSDYSHKTAIFIAGEIVLALAYVINIAMSAKIFSFKGYAIRNRDITYRSGIFFPKTTTVPFCKIQQVTVRMNPVSRIFGLYYIDIVNGTQNELNQITIPGLSHDRARQIETLLISEIKPTDTEETLSN